jgi:hypothetical protein
MVRALLIRGMLVGLLAGLLAFGFARVFGEPQVDLAIAFEEHEHQMAGDAPEEEIVSREVQSSIGLFTGVMTYSTALGGIFALVFAFGYGRIGPLGPRGTAALLAGLGFVAIILVPQIKYPANPPSIGNPETIGSRTALYFTMIALSVIAAAAAISTARQLAHRFGGWNSGIVAAAAYLIVIAIGMAILPPVNEVPAEFSAVTLWNFRLASLGIEAVLWTMLGVVFGLFAERLIDRAEESPALRAARSLR